MHSGRGRGGVSCSPDIGEIWEMSPEDPTSRDFLLHPTSRGAARAFGTLFKLACSLGLAARNERFM